MCLIGLLVIAIVVTVVKAEVDCSQRPPYVNFKDCCDLSNFLTEEVKEKCGGQFDLDGHPHGPPDGNHGRPGPHGGPPGHGPHNHCFLSCVVNETGILDDDELQEDNLVSYLNNVFGDSDKVDFLTSKFISCNEKRKEFASKWPERRNGPHHCPSGGSGMLIPCVQIHSFKVCPDSSWTNSDECNEARDYFKQCRPKKNKFEAEESENI